MYTRHCSHLCNEIALWYLPQIPATGCWAHSIFEKVNLLPVVWRNTNFDICKEKLLCHDEFILPVQLLLMQLFHYCTRLTAVWCQRAHVCSHRCSGNYGAMNSDVLRGDQGQLQWFKAIEPGPEHAASNYKARSQILNASTTGLACLQNQTKASVWCLSFNI